MSARETVLRVMPPVEIPATERMPPTPVLKYPLEPRPATVLVSCVDET